ncbi:acyl-CoA/acyl-ACP dehydrogenase [Janibacter sp. YIM B02568]|uniref:acyl-CoA dehydrogenase family protein n=1 Tax=Janibacter endophyticus TaxID=2806261 RepID=UPI00194E6F51|nr:acyl-CoA dehydrogenase family protein [Janibacter endophyticus]MBM6545444.1 acyl-CoA/acyl-ACP dehydrogenase [Janibacter endophyticus]
MRFTPEQDEFRREIRRFADTHCKTMSQRDALTEGGTLANAPEMFRKLADLGWFAVSLPEEYGGGGAGMVEECIFLEETARGLVPIKAYSTGLTAVQTYLKYGTEDQKKKIVTNLAEGRIEAISLSEPGSGSDLASVRLKATKDGDDYILNGQKTWCSAAHVAEHMLVLARTSTGERKHQGLTLFMVPRDTPGIEMREIVTMEPRTVNDVFYSDARIPAANIVGQVDGAWRHLTRGLAVERLIIATMSTGAAVRALDDVLAYVKEREQFGRSIGSFQAVQHRLAELATEIAFCRAFVYEIADKIDHGLEESINAEAAMAKLKCTEVAKKAVLEAMQLMGGYGFAREYGMEEQVRFNLAPTIYGGANEVQKDIIAKSLGL